MIQTYSILDKLEKIISISGQDGYKTELFVKRIFHNSGIDDDEFMIEFKNSNTLNLRMTNDAWIVLKLSLY